jgi:hypothetical protein
MLPKYPLKTTAATALALGALAAPAASAKPLAPDPVYDPGTSAPTIVRVYAPSSPGFDWGDAGIGAAGGVALAIVGLGGALAILPRRTRPSRPTTLTN